MATRSTVPAVRAALVALLQARPGLAGVQVGYSHPGDALERESMFLGGTRGRHDPANLRAGRKHRDEAYTLDVWVDVSADGPTAQPASERAWALIGELEDVLADDPSLGLGQPLWAVLGECDDGHDFDEETRGWKARIRAGVDIKARLI